MTHDFNRLLPDREPSHPGEYVQVDILEAYGLTQDELANRLGVSRRTISELVNKHRGVSADMALRLGRFTETSADMWLNLQTMHDLWKARHGKNALDIEKITPFANAD